MLRRPLLVFFALALVSGCLAAPAPSDELIVCGGPEVYIISAHSPPDGTPTKVWSWKASDHSEIPEQIRKRFYGTDDCKPVDGGRKILITSSSGGVALVERATGNAVFATLVPNAHSADLLPEGRIAVVGPKLSSSLVVFDLKSPDKPVCSDELPDGHGAVWDEKRQVLWALGGRELRAYRLEKWTSAAPSLKLEGSYELPKPGGHDLYPVLNSSLLSVTTAAHCWFFDRDKRTMAPHPVVKTWSVKSISVSPSTGQTAYVQAEGRNWWAERIHLLNPKCDIRMPGERIYKARWSIPPVR